MNGSIFQIKRFRIAITILLSATILISLSIFIAISIYNHTHSAQIDIIVAPRAAQVILNDHTTLDFGTHQIKPGTYTATIKMDGFITQEYNFTVAENALATISTYLLPTDENASFYLNNPEEAAIVDSIVGDQFLQRTLEFNRRYPIANILPIDLGRSMFRIDHGIPPDNSSDFALFITDFKGNSKEEALDYIRAFRYNPDDYIIIYEYKPDQFQPF